jgi:hypothetical protein
MELWYNAFHAGMLASLATRGAIVAATLYLASATGKAGGLLTVHASAFACGRQEILGVEREAGRVDQVWICKRASLSRTTVVRVELDSFSASDCRGIHKLEITIEQGAPTR